MDKVVSNSSESVTCMPEITNFLSVGVVGVIVALSSFITGVMIARARMHKIAAEANRVKAEADALSLKVKAEADALILKAQAEADKIKAEASKAEAEADAIDADTITGTKDADLERLRNIIEDTQKTYREMGKAYEREISKIRSRVEVLEDANRESENREAKTNIELTKAKTQLEAARLDIINLKEEVCALKKLLGDKDLAIKERDARLQLVILENERLRREANGL